MRSKNMVIDNINNYRKYKKPIKVKSFKTMVGKTGTNYIKITKTIKLTHNIK